MTREEKAALEEALRNLDYPAPRNKLIEVAQTNHAPQGAVDAIRELPETADFQDAEELRDALGIDVPGVRPSGGWQ